MKRTLLNLLVMVIVSAVLAPAALAESKHGKPFHWHKPGYKWCWPGWSSWWGCGKPGWWWGKPAPRPGCGYAGVPWRRGTCVYGLPPIILGAGNSERERLENIFRRVQIERAQLVNNRARLENQWTAIEVDELDRYVEQLRRDEFKLRSLRGDVEQVRTQIVRFVNGQPSQQARLAFRRVVRNMQLSPTAASLLQTTVDYLPSESFIRDKSSVTGKILADDGSLLPPPAHLVGRGFDRLANAHAAFKSSWNQIAQTILDGGRITAEQGLALQASLRMWQQAASDSPSPHAFDRTLCRLYLGRAAALVAKVKRPESVDELQRHLAGYTFHGGDLGDLINHLIDHRLSLRYGSEAQLQLATLGREWVDELDTQIAFLSGRIEHYKQQNRSHDSATHQRLSSRAASSSAAAANRFDARSNGSAHVPASVLTSIDARQRLVQVR